MSTTTAAAPSPSSSRSSRALEKKRRILQGASRVFRRRGLHAAGMREIAAELGMHAGNLYYYFDSKQDLLAFCQEDALGGLLELAEAVTAAPLTPAEKLYLLAVGHVLRLNEGTPGSLAHLEVEALVEPYREAIIAKRNAYERALRRLIDAGVADASLRSVDPRVAAMALLGALNWTVKWYRPDGAKSARQIGSELGEQLVRGLLSADTPFTPPPLTWLPEPSQAAG